MKPPGAGDWTISFPANWTSTSLQPLFLKAKSTSEADARDRQSKTGKWHSLRTAKSASLPARSITATIRLVFQCRSAIRLPELDLRIRKCCGEWGRRLGGAILGDAETLHTLYERLAYITGAALSTMSAFLVLRGLKGLSRFAEGHSTMALAIAQVRDGHSPWVGDSPSSTRIPIRRLPESRCRASPTLTPRDLDQQISVS